MNILYTTPGCPKCRLVQMKLDEAGVDYAVETDVDKAIGLGIRSVPTLQVDGAFLSFPEILRYAQKGGGESV